MFNCGMTPEVVALLEAAAGIDSTSDACEWCGSGTKEHWSPNGDATICTACHELVASLPRETDSFSCTCTRCGEEFGYSAELARHMHVRHAVPWRRRRTLLMCFLRQQAARPGRAAGVAVAAAVKITKPLGASCDMLLRVTALPEELWKGPAIFQFL
jgi:hypothetical protein